MIDRTHEKLKQILHRLNTEPLNIFDYDYLNGLTQLMQFSIAEWKYDAARMLEDPAMRDYDGSY